MLVLLPAAAEDAPAEFLDGRHRRERVARAVAHGDRVHDPVHESVEADHGDFPEREAFRVRSSSSVRV
jgi:hypothetical protein